MSMSELSRTSLEIVSEGSRKVRSSTIVKSVIAESVSNIGNDIDVGICDMSVSVSG
jgi:hypothetical protein